MGISQNAMTRALGVPPRATNEIVLGKRAITYEEGRQKIISCIKHFFQAMSRKRKPCLFDSRSYLSFICPLRVGPLVDLERAPKSWGFFILGVQP